MWPRVREDFPGIAALTVACILGGLVGSALGLRDNAIAPLWPPLGIALGAMTRFGPHLWPAPLLAQLALSFTWGGPDLALLPVVVGGTLAPTVGAVLVRGWMRPEESMGGREARAWLWRGVPPAPVVNLVVAGLPGLGLFWGAGLPPGERLALGGVWLLGDVLSVLLFTPVLLLDWERRIEGPAGSPWRSRAGFLLLESMGLLSWALFGWEGAPEWRGAALVCAYFPLLVYAAMRFGLRGAAAANLLVGLAVVWGTRQGQGPFTGLAMAWNQVQSDLFLAALTATSLAVAASQEERWAAEQQGERQNRFFQRILDSLGSGLMVKDRAGLVLFVNQAWARFRGVGASELEKHSDYDLNDPDREIWKNQDRLLLQRPEKALRWEKSLPAEGGEERHLSFQKEVILLEDGVTPGILVQMVDQTDVLRARENLKRHQARLQAAIEGAEIGLWEWDLETGCFRRDDSWYAIFGYKAEDFAGRDAWADLAHPEDRDRVAAFFVRKVESKASHFEIEYRVRNREGEYRWVHSRGFVTERDGLGNARTVMGVTLDVTARKEVEIRLQEAKESAEQASQAKSYFLANISHEVRTPLNAILGMANILRETGLEGEARECLETILASGNALASLVNDVLDFSKIESGKLELDREEFPLRLCCEDAAGIFRKELARKGVEFNLRVEGEADRYWFGDVNRVRQVLVNLLGNAVKFTETGRIELRAGRVHPEDLPEAARAAARKSSPYLRGMMPEYLKFAVEDTGIGIPVSKRDKLFESFTQVDASTTRKYGGTGLGLAICRRLCEFMGGAIWLESELGQGSTFFFFIQVGREPPPAAGGTGAPAGTWTESSGGESGRGSDSRFPPLSEDYPCRILIVEDNETNRRVMTSMLRRFGYQVAAVGSGEEAVQNVQRRQYDLVLMDVQMPGLDGLAATREIRRSVPRDRQPRIVAITAHALAGDRDQCLLSGMNDFLAKPVSPEALAEAVKAAAPRRRVP